MRASIASAAKQAWRSFFSNHNKEMDCHEFANANSRNDEKYCHTERSEVSKNPSTNMQNHLDISVSTKPQYDNG